MVTLLGLPKEIFQNICTLLVRDFGLHVAVHARQVCSRVLNDCSTLAYFEQKNLTRRLSSQSGGLEHWKVLVFLSMIIAATEL